MERTSFKEWNCSVARTLEVIGDWWTMMIVREAFYGTRTFSGFEKRLGISKSMLSRRLSKMESDGLLVRRPTHGDGRSFEYRLTEKGRALFPVLVSMMQWGDRWEDQGAGAPVVLKRRKSSEDIALLEVRSVAGNPLKPGDLTPLPGPGADAETKSRFGKA